MSIEQEIEQSLREHGFSQVRRVVVEEGIDTTGDPAFYIWVLLDDKVPDKRLNWKDIQPLVEHVEAQVRATHESIWPYVRVRRLREWEEPFDVLERENPEKKVARRIHRQEPAKS
ncbi:MAG: hypothetical protein M3347_07240 [Armatimonadota bacterium]|nr:hypothetical protein [Armatimonadota bacterium]